MTVFGKILVIFTTIFSVVLFGLCLYLYIQTSYLYASAKNDREIRDLAVAGEKAANAGKLKAETERDELAKAAKAAANIQIVDDPPSIRKKLKEENDAKDDQVRTLTRDLKEKSDALLVEQQKTAGIDAIIKSDRVLIDQKNKDLTRLKDLYDGEVKKNATLQDTVIAANQAKTKAEVELIAARDTLAGIQDRMQDLLKELARLRQQALTAGTSPTGTGTSTTARNAPTVMIEGKVLAVGTSGEQVEISIGSDAGLQAGHTLEVYRTTPKPQYLGYIRIIRVEPTRAVGQIVGKPVVPLQRGDTAASKILGS
jgi:hypothetical protein